MLRHRRRRPRFDRGRHKFTRSAAVEMKGEAPYLNLLFGLKSFVIPRRDSITGSSGRGDHRSGHHWELIQIIRNSIAAAYRC